MEALTLNPVCGYWVLEKYLTYTTLPVDVSVEWYPLEQMVLRRGEWAEPPSRSVSPSLNRNRYDHWSRTQFFRVYYFTTIEGSPYYAGFQELISSPSRKIPPNSYSSLFRNDVIERKQKPEVHN